jgi:PAS domain S-box-containing protein
MSNEQKNKAQLAQELAAARQEGVTTEDISTPPDQQLATVAKQFDRVKSLLEIANVLNSSLNYETILDHFLEHVAQLVPADAGSILLIKDNVAHVARWRGYAQLGVDPSFWGEPHTIDAIPSLKTMLHTGQPLLISAVDDVDPWLHSHGKGWVKSHLAMPVRVRGQIGGVLQLDSATPHYFQPDHLEIIGQVVQQASIALSNAQLYNQARLETASRVRAVKDEKNFVSTILNTESAFVLVLNANGEILRLNKALESASGCTAAEIRGRFFWDVLIPPHELSQVKAIFEERVPDRKPEKFQSHLQTRSGKQRVVLWSNRTLTDAAGKIEHIVSTGIDITEEKEQEERLAALHHMSRELNLLRDEKAICQIAIETVSFLIEIKSAGYGLLYDQAGPLDYTYYPVRGTPQVVNLTPSLDDETRPVELMACQSESSNDPPLSADVSESWLSARMQVQDRLVGVLDIESPHSYQFTARDLLLLQTLADQTAIALENARLHRATQRQVAELTSLGSISQAITSTLKLEATLTLITRHAMQLMAAGAASVALKEDSSGDMWFYAASGGGSDFVRGSRLAAGEGIVGWVIEHGQPALVPNVAEDPRFFDRFDQRSGFKTHSLICVPLRSNQRVMGAIEVVNKAVATFTQEDVELLTRLTIPAAIAIENARLFEAEQAAREQAERLQAATATLTSMLDLDDVLNGILVQLQQVIACDNACVLLQKNGRLRTVARRGETTTHQGDIDQTFAIDNPIYEEIEKSGFPVILPDAHTDPRVRAWNLQASVRSWMGIPMLARNKVIGCLTLDSTEVNAYNQADASLAKAFANHATVAIQNAKLFKEVRHGHKQLQSLSRRLVEIQENERGRIARELHDEAGQALTSLMMGLRVIERDAPESETVAARAGQLRQITHDISESLHRLAMDLRPPSLDYLGLVAALRQYIVTFSQQHHLVIEFEAANLDHDRLATVTETNLYRVVQEALTNVSRHAKASRVDILLETRTDKIILVVEDNGIGFGPAAVDQKAHLGLLGIRERVNVLNGEFIVESAVGVGTTLYIEVPYVHSSDDSR